MKKKQKHRKTGNTIPPRHEKLNQALITKKSGSHYCERTDYVRSKEKRKITEFIDTEI